MQSICSHVGAIQWVAENAKIQSKKIGFSFDFSCAYERCRALIKVRNFSLSCRKIGQFVTIGNRSCRKMPRKDFTYGRCTVS